MLKKLLIDTKGNVVIPFVYEEFGSFRDGKVRAKKDGKWGFIDLNKGNDGGLHFRARERSVVNG